MYIGYESCLEKKNNKAAAFLNFIRSLDFISIKKEDFTDEEIEDLPQELQDILLQSEKDIEADDVLSHNEVMNSL